MITEYGYSAFAGQPEVELPGAIVNAETVAHAARARRRDQLPYGLEPDDVFQEDEGKPCNTWGNLMLSFQNVTGKPVRPMADLPRGAVAEPSTGSSPAPAGTPCTLAS